MKLVFVILLLLISGLASCYFYHEYFDKGGAFLPGVLYASATVLIFLITKTGYSTKDLFIYYLLMLVLYMVIYYLTLLSSWFAIFIGLVTAGFGAVASFILVNRFVTPFRFNKTHAFLTGAGAFALMDVWLVISSFVYDEPFVDHYFKNDQLISGFMIEIFLTWQIMVGVRLYLLLRKHQKKVRTVHKIRVCL